MKEDPMKGILFLCVHNSSRSQIAEGWARRLAPAGVGVFSAGSEPLTVNPLAVRVMEEAGIDIGGQRSKRIDDVPEETIDTVVTLCAEEVCPVFPHPVERLHWPLPDPSAVKGDEAARLAAFRSARDDIERRLRALFAAAG